MNIFKLVVIFPIPIRQSVASSIDAVIVSLGPPDAP